MAYDVISHRSYVQSKGELRDYELLQEAHAYFLSSLTAPQMGLLSHSFIGSMTAHHSEQILKS
jgi:hypothetical protein